MPLKPCSFESFYTIHNVPNLAHMTQTVEFLPRNHCKINVLRTVSHGGFTLKSHICTQAPLRDRAHMRICVCAIAYMLYSMPNTPILCQSRVALLTLSTTLNSVKRS